jgi:hypothetical protein
LTALLRVITDLIALLASHGVNFPHYLGHHPGVLIDMWGRWDEGYYTAIAKHGYPLTLPVYGIPHVLTRTAAFAPAYSGVLGAVHSWFGFNYIASGQFVSAVFCIIALAGVIYIIEKQAGISVGRGAAFLTVAFPTGFFLLGDYPDSMALALLVWGFVALQRRRWLIAGLAAGLAFITIFYLAIVFVPLAFEFLHYRYQMYQAWRNERRRRQILGIYVHYEKHRRIGIFLWRVVKGWLYPIVCLFAPIISALLCWLHLDTQTYGDPLAFIHVQKDWNRRFSYPWRLIPHTIKDFAHLRFLDTASQSFMEVFDAATVVALIILAVYCFFRFRASWGLWLTSAVAIFTFQTNLYSETREVLVLFPFFAGMSRFTDGHPWRERVLLFFFLPSAYYLIWRFESGRFAG